MHLENSLAKVMRKTADPDGVGDDTELLALRVLLHDYSTSNNSLCPLTVLHLS